MSAGEINDQPQTHSTQTSSGFWPTVRPCTATVIYSYYQPKWLQIILNCHCDVQAKKSEIGSAVMVYFYGFILI